MDSKTELKSAMDNCPLCKGNLHYYDINGQYVLCPQCDVLNVTRRILEIRKHGQKQRTNDNNSCI